MNEYLRIGVVLKPQGVKGELKVQPLTDDPHRFAALKEVYIESKNGGHTPVGVASVSVREDAVYLTLTGVNDRNDAERLRNTYLCVDRSHAVKLPKGRYFVCDLIGCKVVDTNGCELGTLSDVLQTGAADVYAVRGASKDKNFMVPALKKLLHSVDVEAKCIILDAEVLPQVAVYED